MKKLIAMLLVTVTVLSACATGTTQTESTGAPEPILKAGYAIVDISPTESVPMTEGGEGKKGMSAGVLDKLYATCLYLVDNKGTELYLIAMDMCNMYKPLPDYRLELAKKLGVAESQLMFSASHTHASVNIKETSETSIIKYIVALRKNLESAAVQAKEDAKEVTGMYHSAVETEGLNFVRRYIMNDGSYAGDNYGSKASGYAGHETEGDHQLQLLKFTRNGGKDIVLTNYQGHPHRTSYYDSGTSTSISSDVVGIYREELAQRLDCLALYYNGSSGNMNFHSRIEEENVQATYKDHGKALADYAEKAAAKFTPIALGQIRMASTVYVGDCYHSEDYKVLQATVVSERYKSGMSNSASLKGYEDLFDHVFHAQAIINRMSKPETLDVPLHVICVGGFVACYAPFELFAELGMSIKENSPFEATFVCCYSNNLFSYMPTQLAFDHGGYGPYKCNFEPGTGEILVEEFGKLITGLHTGK